MLPGAVTTWPFTATRPLATSRSLARRDATPARARNAWTRCRTSPAASSVAVTGADAVAGSAGTATP